MRTWLTPVVLALAVCASAQTLKPGQALTKNAKIPKGVYKRTAPGDERGLGAFVIRGNNITVDFSGSTIEGAPPTAEPDQRTGVGIDIQGKNVTIKNVNVRGYKVGLIARNAPGLKILDSDFSYNWKQRLGSTLDREDEGDWMSYHQNEKDEWLRFGAGIYLKNCTNFEIKGNKAQGGENGLMMSRCSGGKIWNNNFSFLSAIGVGMYRSSANKIMHNKIDWCVRGYSHGVYNRGQDSAGILIYEQSNKNIFAYNSVTHGGDGFFLWAGQTTMDTGKGGCNDNLLYGNDFSHAPTNGIEATFSRNNFVNNLIMECWHGIWGGYSYDSKVISNVFRYNAEAIAWEHGQNNVVKSNQFGFENSGLHLWANATQDPNWGYAKKRDTASHDWIIKDNYFFGIQGFALDLARTKGVLLQGNSFGSGEFLKLGTDVSGLRGSGNKLATGKDANLTPDQRKMFTQVVSGDEYRPDAATMQPSGNTILQSETRGDYLMRFNTVNPLLRRKPFPGSELAPKPLPGGMNPFFQANSIRGRRYIFIDQWGPYDFKSPLLWPREVIAKTADGLVHTRYETLGPRGKFVIKKLDGIVELSGLKIGDTVDLPTTLDVVTDSNKATSIDIQFEYRGAATTDYRGIVTPAGQPVRFGYRKFVVPFDWTVKFYQWSEQQNPSDPISPPVETHIRSVFKGEPIKTVKTDRLEYASGGSFVEGVPRDKFATIAEGTFEVPPGKYVLDVTTDDGCKVWVDGKEVISNAWKYQGPTSYNADLNLAAGKHSIRVEHFEIGGYAALKVNLRPRA